MLSQVNLHPLSDSDSLDLIFNDYLRSLPPDGNITRVLQSMFSFSFSILLEEETLMKLAENRSHSLLVAMILSNKFDCEYTVATQTALGVFNCVTTMIKHSDN